jgi:membrane-associated phospholipid phosphatase
MTSFVDVFSSIIYKIGEYGPIILLFISLYLLWNKKNIFFYYSVGVFINSILNFILKGLIQQPRPNEDMKEFNALIKHAKLFMFKDNGVPYDIFGMPSGHIQSCMFSTIFVFLALKRKDILITYLLLTLVTIYQRVHYNFHTILQVIVGGLCGGIFSYYMYYLATQKIKGKIREKPDDFGPL